MRFMPVESAEQQADLLLATERERLVRQRTQLTNMIRAEHQEVRAVSSSGSYT
jgi:transposase